MTITLAFDSFKGSLRSDEVADAFEDEFMSEIDYDAGAEDKE